MQFNLRDNLERNIFQNTDYESFIIEADLADGVLVLIKDCVYFDDDGRIVFNSLEEAEEAIKSTVWWKTIIEYAEFSSKFFLDRVDKEWMETFLQRAMNGMITDGFIKFIDLDNG